MANENRTENDLIPNTKKTLALEWCFCKISIIFKSIMNNLLIYSGIFFLFSTLGFGVVPVLDKISIDKTADIARLYSLQSDINNSLDRGTLQWELARVFLVYGAMLEKLGVGLGTLKNNAEHYRYNLSNADIFAQNAARGFQDSTSISPSTKVLFERPKRTIEEIRDSYPSNVIEAKKRSNRIIAKRNLLKHQAKRWEIAKTNLHMASLIFSCIGIYLGIWALRRRPKGIQQGADTSN